MFYLFCSNLLFLNLLQKYCDPLKSPENAGIIDPLTVDDIFLKVPELYNLHQRFLHDLNRRLYAWGKMQQVGDIFIEMVSEICLLVS